MIKPSFFVVGAPKSGTTSMYYYLKQHSQISMPNIKEIHYFSGKYISEDYYKTDFPCSIGEYEKIFSSISGEKISGDVSPSYLYFSNTVRDIYNYNNDAKIIIMIRNPVERAISHYLMDVQKGFQNKPLSNFYSVNKKNKKYFFQYIECSLYSKHIKEYLEVFGRDNVSIVIMEDLISDPKIEMSKIFKMLGINDLYKIDASLRHNEYTASRFSFLHGIRANSIAYNIFNLLPESLRSHIKKVFLKKGIKPDLVSEKNVLKEIFSADVDEVSNIIDRNLQDVWFNE